MAVNNKKVNTLFKKYYKWLTSCENFNNLAFGQIVNDFCLFGADEMDPHEPKDKKMYIKTFENIARGIIQTSSESKYLNVNEYTSYQIKAVEKIFKAQVDKSDKRIKDLYAKLFEIQDLDKDGKLGVEDLTVSLVYLDMQDGKLNGKLKYEDAITLGYNMNTEEGLSDMISNLNDIKELLYN